MRRNRNSSNAGIIVALLFMIVLAVVSGYIYLSTSFERVAPSIEMKKNIVWNKNRPIKVTISDNELLHNYMVTLSDGKKSVIVSEGTVDDKNRKNIFFMYPKNSGLDTKATLLTLKVEATDRSRWNYFKGNKSEETVEIKIDSRRPNINILSNSYSITQGGSALVVFFADDANLEEVYVSVGELKFKAQPYKKEGYYVALIAWPFTENNFTAKVVARDIANNKRSADIPFYVKKHKYKVSWIEAKDKFINGKITDLAQDNSEYDGIDNKVEMFKAVNEDMRLNNEDMIHELSSKLSSSVLTSWKINKFYPLKNGQKVASYGDERHYYYKHKNNEISKSFHVGYDMASTKMAPIKTSNSGVVVYADNNGIYGNMPMIDHGLGLYSLYGHCSKLSVVEGDRVFAGDVIANTGVSGLALGDHLHFGLVVQGVEVRPIEWFDKEWIRKNIDDIFIKADKIIEKN